MNKKLFFGIAFFTAQLAFSVDPVIYGDWKLKEFTILSANKKESTPFCAQSTGQILYQESGYMSVSINCGPRIGKKEPADDYQRYFFYAGSFYINDKKEVIHQITNSSTLSLIGKDSIRKIEVLDDKQLILTGAFGADGKTLRIVWDRNPTAPNAAVVPAKPGDAFAMLTILKVKPGKEEVAAIVKPTLAEPDNVAWYVQQSAQDSTEFLFYTRWKDDAGLNAHLGSASLAKYLKNTSDMLVPGHLQLVRYWPIDGQNKTRRELGLVK